MWGLIPARLLCFGAATDGVAELVRSEATPRYLGPSPRPGGGRAEPGRWSGCGTGGARLDTACALEQAQNRASLAVRCGWGGSRDGRGSTPHRASRVAKIKGGGRAGRRGRVSYVPGEPRTSSSPRRSSRRPFRRVERANGGNNNLRCRACGGERGAIPRPMTPTFRTEPAHIPGVDAMHRG